MRNKFPGSCYRCGEMVAAGAGHFERIPYKQRKSGDPKWRTQHADCAIEHRGSVHVHAPCADPSLASARENVEEAISVFQDGGKAQVSATHLYWFFAEREGLHKADCHVSKFNRDQCNEFILMLHEIKPSNVRTWKRKRSRQRWDDVMGEPR